MCELLYVGYYTMLPTNAGYSFKYEVLFPRKLNMLIVCDKRNIKYKHYKTGENRKLAPRRGGPWIVLEKLPNGVNFKV